MGWLELQVGLTSGKTTRDDHESDNTLSFISSPDRARSEQDSAQLGDFNHTSRARTRGNLLHKGLRNLIHGSSVTTLLFGWPKAGRLGRAEAPPQRPERSSPITLRAIGQSVLGLHKSQPDSVLINVLAYLLRMSRDRILWRIVERKNTREAPRISNGPPPTMTIGCQ